jgi:hypothetical protein
MGFAVKTHCSLYFEIPQNHRSDVTLINQDLRERNVARRDRERNRESNTERERERTGRERERDL